MNVNLKLNLNEVALEAARKIEDMFAQSWVGGVVQRRAAIQVQVLAAMNIAIKADLREFIRGTDQTGDWNGGPPGPTGPIRIEK